MKVSFSRIWKTRCKSIAIYLVALVTSVGSGFAENSKRTAAIIVYGDTSGNWVEYVQDIANILDPIDRPDVLVATTTETFPENAILVWFGNLDHSTTELEGVPDVLGSAVKEVASGVSDHSHELADGQIRVGVNCFTRHIDRADGFPRIAVNFSGENGRNFCKGLTSSHVVLRASRWMQNDGTDCLLRDCAKLKIGGRS